MYEGEGLGILFMCKNGNLCLIRPALVIDNRKDKICLKDMARFKGRSGNRLRVRAVIDRAYFIPMTMESGPIKCSTRVSRNPASLSQVVQSAPV